MAQRFAAVKSNDKELLAEEVPATAPRPKPTVGAHLRMARLARGLTLKTVADEAGCSEGLLSKIENDKADPSLRLLHQICAIYKMTTGDLLSWAEVGSAVVLRAADRMSLKVHEEGQPEVEISRLAHSGFLLAGFLNRISPGSVTGELFAHPGEELGYLITGNLDLVVGDTTHRVAAGDSFCFRSDIPHGYRNRGATEALVIVVNSPPSY